MHKKHLTLFLPSLITGCAGFASPPETENAATALVFVDGQISERQLTPGTDTAAAESAACQPPGCRDEHVRSGRDGAVPAPAGTGTHG
ncbi:PilL protein [Escherichia coli]|nr:PilL protein [Escherichia coli]